MGVGSSFADRAPRHVGPGRPFVQSAFESALDGARLVRPLERRVDQDDSATLLRRQIGVERDIAVRADDAEPTIAPECGDQRLAFVRIRFAERDAVLRAREGLRDRWRTRIAQRPALGLVRADGFKIGAQKLGDRRRWVGLQNPCNPLAPFWRSLRLRAHEIEAARPGVCIDETEGALLAGQINENAGENRVLEHVGEVAGMKGVAIVDRNSPPIPRSPGTYLNGEGASISTTSLRLIPMALARSLSRSLTTSLSGARAAFVTSSRTQFGSMRKRALSSTAGTPPEKR